jgi:5-oxoprolinase (ATP-hydrolysing)
MGLADVRALREEAVELPLEDALAADLSGTLDRLAAEAYREIAQQDVPEERIAILRNIHLRYEGTDSALEVPFAERMTIVSAFEVAHKARYGFVDTTRRLIVEAAAVEVIGAGEVVDDTVITPSKRERSEVPELARVESIMAGKRHQTPVIDRDHLNPGDEIPGPAIISESTGTTIVEPGWSANYTDRGHLVMARVEALPDRVAIGTDADPVMLEIFNNLYMSIAEQMGVVLAKTSHSVNIKERLDFSCALFDGEGELIANAPHMPVHLGSMSESVQAVVREHRDSMCPGDVYVLNAPYNGGTHLPDVTVVTPVFDDDGKPLFYTASRGHHADIGGISPGSMPPFSQTVDEEGVLLDNIKLMDKGHLLEDEIRAVLSSGRYPSRNVDNNIADLKAQIAANEKGVQELGRIVEHYGLDVVHAYMTHVQNNAEESVRRVIDVLHDGKFIYPMDDGSQIAVSIKIDHDRRSARIDFTGTSAQLATNYNAPTAVCRAAVLYVFRSLVKADIPLNAGCLAPIELIIPDGSMLNPKYPAAVVAGNVETSQCTTDALFGALGVVAAAQGTMNNFTFGNDRWQYYETICGGAGAGTDFDGASAVHTHMTNSRLTDPEILEWRFPVLLEQFEIRRGSGGKGRHNGGDGTLRRIKFLETMTASILASHRVVPPFGLNGGQDGECGRNWVERTSGAIDELAGRDETDVHAGDIFVIQTPTGGGFGNAT